MTQPKLISDTIWLEDPYGIGSGLKCPRCSGSYLHQGTVRVFDRGEDSEWTVVTTVAQEQATTQRLPTRDSGNPSPRRHGVIIDFTCELCAGIHDNMEYSAPIELRIVQHKGCTYLSWCYDPEMPEADIAKVFRWR